MILLYFIVFTVTTIVVVLYKITRKRESERECERECERERERETNEYLSKIITNNNIFNKKIKILLIVTVEDSVKNVNIMKNNYKILENVDEITWCFNHFDGANELWKTEDWYYNINGIKNIGIGSKITQWKKITPQISKHYDYLWFLDGDMGLEKFNWNSYYNMLVNLNPILSQPGILPAFKGGRASEWPHTNLTDKNKNTIYKGYNKDNVIENGTPFISTKIWDLIYEKMILTDDRSDWETCNFFNKIAIDLNSPRLINFISPVVHHDYRNLNKIKSVDSQRKLFVSPDPDDYKTKILNIKNTIKK